MPDDHTIDPRDLASLAALRRLSQGAAHSLNNAFAAALGEVGYLLEERKDDGEVVEACQIIQEALERSVGITRGLLARRETASADDETDLDRLLTSLAGLLSETLGRSHPLHLVLPREWIGVAVDPVDMDLVLTTLIQFAADASGEMSRLEGVLDRSESDARFTLHVTSNDLPPGTAAAIDDPDRAATPLLRSCLATVRGLVDRAGGSLHAEQTAPDGWALVLRLPAID